MRRVTLAAALCALAAPTSASARDYAETALNIVPSGQYGGFPVPAGADEQARMYDALTPLFDRVGPEDLTRTFKSARLGDAPGPTRVETVPRKGVSIVRDRFNVPHIKGRTKADVTWAMGWVLQADRGLLLAQARNAGRMAALEAPGVNAFGLVTGLKQVTPSKQADRLIKRMQERNLRAAGREGRAVIRDIDLFVAGANAKLRADKSEQKPYTRVDIYGAMALAGELFGRGGGDEARRSAFLDGLRTRVGPARAQSIFDDLSSTNDPDRPDTGTKAFPYNRIPKSKAGNVVIDHGSLERVTHGAAPASASVNAQAPHASNFLMVSGRRSTNGHPLFVAGPQIGYFYPGLTLEADISWPGHSMRGIYSPAHPGYIFIGRGEDFAYSLTSAGNDSTDQFVETLCGGSDTRYRYKGKCRAMGRVNAGSIKGTGDIIYRTTVHGPVVGYATVKGRKVAISNKRSSYGRDAVWMLPFRDATLGKVRSAEDLYRSAYKQPYTFNVAYADDKDIAMFSAGRLPVRDRRVDPRLPTNGNGKFEWKGFLPYEKHPRQKNPGTGALLNWNNRPSPRFGSADNDWEHGPLHRNNLLEAGIAKRDKHDAASVTAAMNAAATQDLRSAGLTPVLATLLRGAPAPSPRAERMLQILEAWRGTGSSRLDVDEDGAMDAGAGPAIWDALYPRLVDTVMGGALGEQLAEYKQLVGANNNPRSGFTNGGINHVYKDLQTLAGGKFSRPYRIRFCGGGDVNACRTALWAAMDETGAQLEREQGNPAPDAWRANADAERISFAPGLLPLKIRYTNRPSGIQQVMSFTGHRKRR